MDAILILIDGDAELLRARALVDQLWNSNDPADVARLEAQARLVAAYEEMKWPRRPPSVGDLIRHLMDQHGLTRADLIPLLGTTSRVSEVLRGKKGLSMADTAGDRQGPPERVLAPQRGLASIGPVLRG
jgi:HTH-type transcriptional regulator/antitoxin HigA